ALHRLQLFPQLPRPRLLGRRVGVGSRLPDPHLLRLALHFLLLRRQERPQLLPPALPLGPALLGLALLRLPRFLGGAERFPVSRWPLGPGPADGLPRLV